MGVGDSRRRSSASSSSLLRRDEGCPGLVGVACSFPSGSEDSVYLKKQTKSETTSVSLSQFTVPNPNHDHGDLPYFRGSDWAYGLPTRYSETPKLTRIRDEDLLLNSPKNSRSASKSLGKMRKSLRI